MELDKFADRIQVAASKSIGRPITGGSDEHAVIGVEKLFAVAEQTVEVLSGTFNPHIYGNKGVVETASRFLAKPGAKMRILLEVDDPAARDRHAFFRMAAGYSNVETRIRRTGTSGRLAYHFMVVDSRSYRLRMLKHPQAALYAFGDGPGAENLSGIFGTAWEKAMALPEGVAA